MSYLSLMQWPAMLVTVVAAWLVAADSEKKRMAGFWTFLASNVLWIVWGLFDHAYALIVLQLSLAAMNIRGAIKAQRAREQEKSAKLANGNQA